VIVGAFAAEQMPNCDKSASSEGAGTANSREGAINAALSEGIAKVTGATLRHETDPNAVVTTREIDAKASGATIAGSVAAGQSTSLAATSSRSAALASSKSVAAAATAASVTEEVHIIETSRSGHLEILTSSGGSVKNFTILSVDADQNGHYTAHVRMDVLQCPSAEAFATRMAERLTTYLIQTRRFAVLDRAQDDAYAAEMSKIQSDEVPLKERVRIGQVLAADYVIVGKLNSFGATTATTTNALTGDSKARPIFSASADFQVIDIATRQIKWSGNIKLVHETVEGLAEAAAQAIGEDISQTIYPLRAIKIDDPASIVINQGGETLKTGQIYKAYKLGEDMKDPYSKESLGRAEQEIATLKITRVDAKLAYGAVHNGTMSAGDDVILRRVRGSDGLAASAAKPKALTPTPFD